MTADSGVSSKASPHVSYTGYPSARRGWWALLVFTLALILSYLDRNLLTLLVEPIRQELDVRDTEMSLLIGAAFAVLYALAGLPLGRAADLFARRRLIVVGVGVWSAATVGCGFAATYGQLFLARVLVGIGEAALLPAAVSMLADFFPPTRRGTAMAILGMGAAVGSSVSLILGGFLIDAVGSGTLDWIPGTGNWPDWRVCFLVVGTFGVPVALLIFTVREPERRGRTTDRPNTRQVIAAFQERRQVLIPVYSALAFMGIAATAQAVWLPAFLERVHGMEASSVGKSLGASLLIAGISAALFTGVAGDKAVSRWGTPARLVVALPVCILAFAGSFAGWGETPFMVFVFAGLMVAGAAGMMGLCGTTVQDVASNEMRGVAGALVSLMGTLVGMGAGPTFVSLVTEYVYGDSSALGKAMTAVSLACTIASVLMLVVAVRNARRAHHIGS